MLSQGRTSRGSLQIRSRDFLPAKVLAWRRAQAPYGAGQAGGAAAPMWIPDGLQSGPRRLMQTVSVSEELEDVFVLLCAPSLPPPQTNARHASGLARPAA